MMIAVVRLLLHISWVSESITMTYQNIGMLRMQELFFFFLGGGGGHCGSNGILCFVEKRN